MYIYTFIMDKSHEKPGTRGIKLKVFRNNLKIVCDAICNRPYACMCICIAYRSYD